MNKEEAKAKAWRMLFMGYSASVIVNEIWNHSSLMWLDIVDMVEKAETKHNESKIPLENITN